jgi:hypothetical protein
MGQRVVDNGLATESVDRGANAWSKSAGQQAVITVHFIDASPNTGLA